MNSELKGAITTVLVMVVLLFIFVISGFVVGTLIIFDVIKAPLVVKILSYITNILISIFFGIFIFYNKEGGNKK